MKCGTMVPDICVQGTEKDEKDKNGIANGDTADPVCAVFLRFIGADSAGG